MATRLSKDEIAEALGNLTVLEMAELVKLLEEKFGVSAAAPVGMAAMPMPGAGAGAAAAAEEQTEFDAILKSIGELTGLGLKEAKDLVDGAPKPVKEKVSKQEAEQIKTKLEAEGATVEVK